MSRGISKNTKRLTFCAVCVALGVVILLLGSLIDVLDLTSAALAGMISVIIVIEFGGAWPWAVYMATGFLSLLLLPAKLPAVFYLLFGGWYPIVKEKIEKIKNRYLSWTIKILLLNVSIALLMVVAKYVLMLPDEATKWSWILFVLANFAFVLFDIALTKIITVYILRLRNRFHMDRFK